MNGCNVCVSPERKSSLHDRQSISDQISTGSFCEGKIRVESLSFSVESRTILHEVSLKVKKGMFVGLIGPNGCGKTTLIKHLYGALPIQSGCVYLDDQPIGTLTQRELAQRLTVVLQEQTADFPFTVMQMVLMGRAPYRGASEGYNKEDKKFACESLEYVGMLDQKDKPFSMLSGGEKQRVLIARSLTQKTEIILLDEPTNHLDIYYQLFITNLLSEQKKTVLAVFHDINLAAKYCEYLYVMKDGQIVAEGSPYEVITEEMIRGIFRVEAKVTSDPDSVSVHYQRALK